MKVRREKLQDLQERGKDPFQITKYDMTHHSMEIKDNFDELEGKTVSIAGRMMFKRVMGKASFCNIQDLTGQYPGHMWQGTISEKTHTQISRNHDIGDIYGIKGIRLQNQDRRDFYPCREDNTSFQEPPDTPGEVPWTDRHRHPLSSEICRPDHESGESKIHLSNVPQILKEIRNFLAGTGISWKLRHRCLYQMQVVRQQDHSRHISTH